MTTKRRGVDVTDGTAVVADVLTTKTFYAGGITKLTGTSPDVGTLVEHQNGEVTQKGTSYSYGIYLSDFADGTTICSASVTTTKRTCIVVVSSILLDSSVQRTQIKRGGVDKTLETTISGGDTGGSRIHVQYATEVLAGGTYQYDLVASGSTVHSAGATIKVVAVSV